MVAVKGINFGYQTTPQTRELLSRFRDMVNDAIRICLAEDMKGRLKLRDRIYREFQERYGVMACFPYCVAEVAWSIVKKHKHWHRKPFAKRMMFKMDAANFSLSYSVLSLPFRKGERVLVPLKYGEYQRSFLMDKTLKRGSVTMTESSIVIAFSKDAPTAEPSRRVGYDINEKSSMEATGLGMTSQRWRDCTPSTAFVVLGSTKDILVIGVSGRTLHPQEERKSG